MSEQTCRLRIIIIILVLLPFLQAEHVVMLWSPHGQSWQKVRIVLLYGML